MSAHRPQFSAPRQDLLLVRDLRRSLARGAVGGAGDLLSARGQLDDLRWKLRGGPWSELRRICDTLERLLAPCLRGEALAPVDTLGVAGELVDYMEHVLDRAGVQSPLMPGSEWARTPADVRPSVALTEGGVSSASDSRLGEVLIRMGRLDEPMLSRALVLQKLSKKRLGEVLLSMHAIDEAALDEALEVQREETQRLAEGLRRSSRLPDR